MLAWLTAFVWTLAIELPIYARMIELRGRWSVVVLVVAINAITHPLLWFVFPRIEPRWLFLLAGETSVIAIEALAIAVVIRRPGRALAASLAANLASWAGGTMLWWLVAR